MFLVSSEQRWSLGITRNNISIWMKYAYDQQCSTEFFPDDLKLTGQGWNWELGFFIFLTAHHNITNTYINDSIESARF